MDEPARVTFALSYMSGKASVWGQSLTNQLLDVEKRNLVTWKKFIDSFKATFFDSERLAKAEREIRALKQTRSVSDYWIKFAELALVVKWPESVLLSQFEQGLKTEVSVYMIREEFTEVEDMAKFAIKLDNKLNKRTHDVNYHANVSTTPAPVQAPPTDPDAMDCSAYRLNITNDEYRRRGMSSECYACGKTDHYIADCPTKKRGGWRGREGSRFRGEAVDLDQK